MRGQRSVAAFLLCFLLTLTLNSSAQNRSLPPRVGGISFADVIRLSQAGLSENTIIAQIKMRAQPFDLSPDELLQLKAAHVPNRVIEAMVGPAVAAPSLVERKPAASNPQTPTILPTDPGMYLASPDANSRILGQIVTFRRTGSLLVTNVTFGIKARHQNVQLPGPHARLAVHGQPVFYFIPTKQEAEAGLDAGDLVLIHLEEKAERRQFEVDAQGLWRASSGISITHQVRLIRSAEGSGVYKITTDRVLPKGEYALYLLRGENLSAYIYDFSSGGNE